MSAGPGRGLWLGLRVCLGSSLLLTLAAPAQASEAAVARPAPSDTPAAKARPHEPAAAGIEPHIGAQLPLGTRFRASDGRDVALGDVLAGGKPTLLVLAYNRCAMLCSLVLRSVARVMTDFDLRPGEQFSLVTLSIDPSETVFEASRLQTALLDTAGLAGETQRWNFLVGDRPSIDAVAGALGFRYVWDPATEQYNHPAVLFSLAPGGRVSGYFNGLNPDRAALRNALTSPVLTLGVAAVQDVILNCFRFDTTHSRYGAAITWLLRTGAASVAVGLIALLWWLARHARTAAQGQP